MGSCPKTIHDIMFDLEPCLSFAVVYRGTFFLLWSESQRVATCNRTSACLRDTFVFLVQLGSVASGLGLLREDTLPGHVTWGHVVVVSAKIKGRACGRVVEKPASLLCVKVWALQKTQVTPFRKDSLHIFRCGVGMAQRQSVFMHENMRNPVTCWRSMSSQFEVRG